MAATVDPNNVKDLIDHLLSEAPKSTDPQQMKLSSSGKGKRKAPATLTKAEPDSDIMELTFKLKNAEALMTYIGTKTGLNGGIIYMYKYKKAEKKAKLSFLTANSVPNPAVDTTSTTSSTTPPLTTDPTTAPAIAPASAPTTAAPAIAPVSAPTAPTTAPTMTTASAADLSATSNPNAVTDFAQYIEDFKNKMFEKMDDDNVLLQVLFCNFFAILTNVIGNKPMTGSLESKLNVIQLMANAMRAKEDNQTDKEAFVSFLKSRCSANNFLKRGLKIMKTDNSKSVEDLTDMFLDKLME